MQLSFVRLQEVSPTSTWDDSRPRVTWRGDGQFVAVSAVCPETGMVPNSTEIPTCLKGFLSGIKKGKNWLMSVVTLAT